MTAGKFNFTKQWECQELIRRLKAERRSRKYIYDQVKLSLGVECPSRTTVYQWIRHRVPRPRKLRYEEIIRDMLEANRHLTLYDIVKELGISRGTAGRIVRINLCMVFDTKTKAWKTMEEMNGENNAADAEMAADYLFAFCNIDELV